MRSVVCVGAEGGTMHPKSDFVSFLLFIMHVQAEAGVFGCGSVTVVPWILMLDLTHCLYCLYFIRFFFYDFSVFL